MSSCVEEAPRRQRPNAVPPPNWCSREIYPSLLDVAQAVAQEDDDEAIRRLHTRGKARAKATGSLRSARMKKPPRPPRAENPQERSSDEERVYGLHACLALFRARREDIRRVYVTEQRLPDVKTLLRWCAKNSIAYHVVADENLEKVTRSTHHEGISLLAKKPAAPSLPELLEAFFSEEGPVRLLLLENVRDPHNVGAIVRTAAHFGVRAVLLAKETARRSSALLRTAEGGAEVVALVPVEEPLSAAAALKDAGFTLVATSSHAEHTLERARLPAKVCVMLGAEREGMSKALLSRADHLVRVDGTGAVESLNVAAATAVILADLWRRAPLPSAARSPTADAAPKAAVSAPRPQKRPRNPARPRAERSRSGRGQ